MAGNLRYLSQFTSIDGDNYEIRVYDERYTGDVIEVKTVNGGFTWSENIPDKATEPIVSSTAKVEFVDNGEFDDFIIRGLTQCAVQLVKIVGDGVEVVSWSGYISPEIYDVQSFGKPSTVRYNANSPSALMKKKNISGRGSDFMTFGEILEECFEDCGFTETNVAYQLAAVLGNNYQENSYPYGMWRLRVARQLFSKPVVNDSDETENRQDYDSDTWDEIVGDILRYFGLRLIESFEDDCIYLVSPWESFGGWVLIKQTRSDFAASDGDYETLGMSSKNLSDLNPGGLDNRMSRTNFYSGAKVHAAIEQYDSPVMSQEKNQRTEIIQQSIDVLMSATYVPNIVYNILSGMLRNAGNSPDIYVSGDLKCNVFTSGRDDTGDYFVSITNLSDQINDVFEDYTTERGTVCKNLIGGGAYPIYGIWGEETTLDERKTVSEYIETIMLQRAAWSNQPDGGQVYVKLPNNTALLSWEQNGVTLIGDFAWSIYYRIFTEPHYSKTIIPSPGVCIQVSFWWKDGNGNKYWWDGDNWYNAGTTTALITFLPEYDDVERYPSSTVKTVFPEGTEFVGLKGEVMRHGYDMPPAVSYGFEIRLRDVWHNQFGSGDDAKYINQLFLRDLEVGIGSDRNQYALNRYTGEVKTEYYYRKDSYEATDTDEIIEEEFPFHTYNRSPLSISTIMIGNEYYNNLTQFYGIRSNIRHENALVARLADYYGKSHLRYTLEIHDNPKRAMMYSHGGRKFVEISRSYRPMDGITSLTVEEYDNENDISHEDKRKESYGVCR